MSLVESMKTADTTRSSDSRLVAAKVLQQVLDGRSLSDAAPRYIGQIDNPRDRGLAQEMCYGVMRWFLRLEGLLRLLLKRPLKAKDRDITALLLIGLYQLLYLRVAEHAAVHETAGAAHKLRKRWAVGLINGVLREFQRSRSELLAQVDADVGSALAMPMWLLESIQQRWPSQWQERVAALNERPPMSLRVNRQMGGRDEYLRELQAAGIMAEVISVTGSGVTLEQAQDVVSLPGFSQGRVSVQDGGAQLAAELLQLAPGQWVLDACAAPGGKTCHLLELVENLRVAAVDVDPSRLQRVRENLARLNLEAEVEVGDAARPKGVWAEREYDRILLDVPCSATGVIRRHPDIKYLRRPGDIAQLVSLQAQILHAIWPLLKPGGLLLYVTCSILQEENEMQVAAFLQQQPDASERRIEASWGERRTLGRQIPPGMLDMDGFYYACLEKRA